MTLTLAAGFEFTIWRNQPLVSDARVHINLVSG